MEWSSMPLSVKLLSGPRYFPTTQACSASPRCPDDAAFRVGLPYCIGHRCQADSQIRPTLRNQIPFPVATPNPSLHPHVDDNPGGIQELSHNTWHGQAGWKGYGYGEGTGTGPNGQGYSNSFGEGNGHGHGLSASRLRIPLERR